ncbi:hypothetical protein [Pengzhenrongella sp.]|uniref:hypothetical protein n=1 Tax=Pengzhenrongella sp. TaxID=2888820 RepID=UPI002F92BED7
MPAYLARITVFDVLDDDERAGMGDALGAHGEPEMAGEQVVFSVLGEAPDLPTASAAATQHTAEVLDGYTYEVDVAGVL